VVFENKTATFDYFLCFNSASHSHVLLVADKLSLSQLVFDSINQREMSLSN